MIFLIKMNEQNFESSDNESIDDVPITVSDKGDGELILNELIVYNYDVRHEFSEEYFVGYQIASLLGYANTKQVIINNVSKCNRLIFRDLPDDIKKPELNPKTILINRDGAIEILIKTRKRISPDVLHILKSFRIETTNKKCLTKEQQTLSALTNAFKTEKFEDQFKVGKYFLDLYFPEYKIVVECDENGHADRKPCNERERMDFVNEKLELTDENWIRYNPDAEDFDISKVIGKIYRTIDYIKTKKFELETKKLEEYLQNQIPVNICEKNRIFNIHFENHFWMYAAHCHNNITASFELYRICPGFFTFRVFGFETSSIQVNAQFRK
jgi:very-short-patch-repair endonuclease